MTLQVNQIDDEALSAAIAEKASSLAALRAQVAALHEQILAEVDVEDALKDEQARRKAEQMEQAGTPDWRWLLDSTRSSRTHYRSLEDYLRIPQVPHCYGVGTGSGHADGTQYGLSIQLVKDYPALTQQVLARLMEVLPHVELLKAHDGRMLKHIDILEASLSREGSYFMAINEAEGLFEVHRRNYGLPKLVSSAKCLPELLQFVEQELYYKTVEELEL